MEADESNQMVFSRYRRLFYFTSVERGQTEDSKTVLGNQSYKDGENLFERRP